ncbi:MAG: 16S rRNA processing protein RimM [candidate division Zixibacteria bacterium]|nr:16S rRNA processing protein RimM [candidate division Zixibacteria bacterium]
MSRVTIGQICRVRGIRGEMVVSAFTDDPRRFRKLQKVTISKGGGTREFLVEKAKEFKGKALLKLVQVRSPEEAEKLVGGFIEIERDQMVELPEGRYFVFDIIGLPVITTKGQRIGTVKEVISLPANDLYLVEGDQKLYHIPATKEVVKRIDLKERKMIIEPLAGLLEL